MKNAEGQKEEYTNSAKKTPELKKRYRSPLFYLIVLTLTFFISQLSEILLLEEKPTFSLAVQHGWNAALFFIFLSPALYFFLFRPLMLNMNSRELAEKELEMKSKEMEKLTIDLRDLSSRLSIAEEQSRRNFAKILHEQMGQNLIGMRIKCHDLMKGTISDKAEIKNTAKNLISLIDDTIRSTRDLTSELYPVILDNLGFIPAVTWYKELVLESRDLKVLAHIDRSVESLSSEYKLSLFRIVQEAFQNIAKHASATDVKMELRKKDNHIQLTIKDNGVGFDLQKTEKNKGKGVGIMLIKERVLSLGGDLRIKSELKKGFEFDITIPI